MAELSADIDAGKADRTWERNSTRQAILDAARRLAAREGADAITLSRVAAEAGFAPPAVYAYFVSKDDLHLAVVADDLEKLARAMRGEDTADSESDEQEPGAEDGTEEDDSADQAADVIALHPAAAEGDADDGEVDADPENTAGEVDAADAEMMQDAVEMADGEAADGEAPEEADASDSGDTEFGAGDAPATASTDAELAAAETIGSSLVSLRDIEQAIGVVLEEANDDFVEPLPPGEDVPDAFPEEALDDGDEYAGEVDEEDGAPWNDEASGDVELDALVEFPPPQTMPAVAAAMPAPAAAQSVEAALAELQAKVARLEQTPVDSWLERRLRVFERTLGDLETRMEKVERDSTTALTTVSESFKALEDRFGETEEGAERRVAESEQQHREMNSDLRRYVKDLSGRLSAVETGLSRMLHDPAGMPSFPDAPRPQAEMPAFEPAPSVAEMPAEKTHEPRAMHEVTGENYLSIARRAANSAADADRGRPSLGLLNLPDLGEEPGWIPAWATSRRSLQIIAGVLALIVAFIGFRIVTRGHAPVKPAAATHVTKTITMTPDDRVVALAKAGNANAELVVALKLMNGDGVSSDLPSAAHWLRKAAVQKQPVAEYWMGTLYERGRGVEKDRAKAVAWYDAAAKAGNAKAMYRLGVAYVDGWTGEANYVAAANWFKQSAHLGIIDAEFNLAVLYERGQGVPQSMTQAFTWYAIAAGQGDSVSTARIKALTAQITPAQIATARAAAAKIKIGAPAPAANVEPTVAEVAAQKLK